MEGKANIILCGFMATGKSSVGKRLAELAHFEFIDMDAAIEEEEGVGIPQIFAERGEAAFRELESRMVERLMGRSGLVISTGGGTVVSPRNLANLKKCGVVIALTADVQTILRRTAGDTGRPLLQTEDREEKIRALLEKRMAAYNQADVVLDTSSSSVEEVAQALLRALQ
ncbi:MAG: shikimate kinase [Acidobacteriota bacterium]|jgi:shikimate kinase|nr:shikimate kinase [Acidobacteriota bacterium]